MFETADPEQVAGHIEAFCLELLGAPVDSALFYGSSAGCVAGLRLGDGREVVVKAYQPSWGQEFLCGVATVQGHLADAGFPCPGPVAGPGRAGPAWATAETLLADPGMRTLNTEAEMAASASGLATVVRTCRLLDVPGLVRHPLNAPAEALYPSPHNPIFDFSLDSKAATWIDDLARAAKDARSTDSSRPVIGHTDWSARNIRITGNAVTAVYDWDSVALCPEATIVGQAGATWRSTGEAQDPVAPDADEVREYISAYEDSSGHAFDSDRVRAAMAAALWVLAYTARCEHALEQVTGQKVDRARARLASDGDAFLRP